MKRFKGFLVALVLVALVIPGVSEATSLAKKATVKRLYGDNRINTSIAVSKEAYPGKADTVILAGYDGQADALTGTLLAKEKNAPLLLTYKNKVDKKLMGEIKRLGANNVYILGGETVVYESVENDLKKEGLKVKRLKGNNRMETAVAIAEEVFGSSKPKEAFVVEYNALVDALAIGSVAAEMRAPIFITQKDKVPTSTQKAIKSFNINKATIIGGDSTVTPTGKRALEKDIKDVGRVFGKDRIETSLAVANKYNPNATSLILANGWTLPDALVGGYLSAKTNAPILLISKDKISQNVGEKIRKAQDKVYILGGTTVVSPKVESDIAGIISGYRNADVEPNDSYKQANSLYLNETIKGKISSGLDKDFYKLEVPSDGKVALKVVSTDGIWLDLILHGAKGTEQFRIAQGNNKTAVNIIEGLAKGTYYIEVSAFLSNGNNYTLENTFVPNESPGDDASPNYINASSIDMNSSTYGHIAYTHDNTVTNNNDYYKLVVPSDGTVDIDVTQLDGGRVNLYLYGINGSDDVFIANSLSGIKRSISRGLAKGTYYIRIQDSVGQYGAYKLDIKHKEQTIPNDNSSSKYIHAPEVNPTSSHYGRIAYINEDRTVNERDFYKVNLDRDGKLDIDATHLDGERLRLYLYGENGNDGYPIASSYGESKPKISKELKKGTYYILVGEQSGEYGGYELNLNFK